VVHQPADLRRRDYGHLLTLDSIERTDAPRREQQPDVEFTADERARIAEALAAAGVHRIEAGLLTVPSSDAEAVKRIARAGRPARGERADAARPGDLCGRPGPLQPGPRESAGPRRARGRTMPTAPVGIAERESRPALYYVAGTMPGSLPVSMPGSHCPTSKKPHRTLVQEPRYAMTTLGPGAAWTGTPRTSSPRTSPAPPGRRHRLSAPPGGDGG
jgi:hypothetical protein